MYRLEFITQNVMSLSDSEKDELFQLITDHVDIFTKILPDLPLLDYIRHGTNPYDHELVDLYITWKEGA